MRILLDFDSVTADLDAALLGSANERFETSYSSSDVVNWNWWFETPPKEHAEYVWGPECFKSRDWTLGVPPVLYASQTINAIRGLGHQFVVVSDRKPYMAEWLFQWLAYRGLFLPIVIADKATCPKLKCADVLGLEVVIEDAPHHAETMLASGRRVFLIDKPYNRCVDDHSLLTRVSGWQEIGQAFWMGQVGG